MDGKPRRRRRNVLVAASREPASKVFHPEFSDEQFFISPLKNLGKSVLECELLNEKKGVRLGDFGSPSLGKPIQG